MDTKKLVVGQTVRMVSGVYCNWGKVVEVTPDGYVIVQCSEGRIGGCTERRIRFSPRDGESCDGEGTFECGPWELEDNPEALAAWKVRDDTARAGDEPARCRCERSDYSADLAPFGRERDASCVHQALATTSN